MKFLKLLTVITICLGSLKNNAQGFCLAESDGNPYYMSTPENSSSPITLRIATHIVKCVGCPDPYTESDVFDNIQKLNTSYNQTNISFEWDGCINIVEDNQFNSGIPAGFFSLAYYNEVTSNNAVPNAINIFYLRDDYTFPIINSGGGVSLSIGGESSPSLSILIAGSDSYQNSSHRIIDINVISHEVGHMLGLYHTHHSFIGEENVDRTGVNANCDVAGDLLCGTAADPDLGWNVDQNCNWTSSGTDIHNVPYVPDPTNILSSTIGECILNFTDDQIVRMNTIIAADIDLQTCVVNAPLVQTNCSCSIDEDITIIDDVTFSNQLNFNSIITIENGAKLTINNDIKFGLNGEIIVKRGGELEINNSTLSSCNTNERWQGIILEGNPYYAQGTGSSPSGEVTLNGATIENAVVGITTYIQEILFTNSGGLVTANNSNFVNCLNGIDFGSYGYFGWTIQDDASILTLCTFDNCDTGIKAKWNRGVETKRCTLSNSRVGIELGTSSMLIDNNTFDQSTNYGLWSHHNWPQIEGSTITNNTCATGYDVILSGPGNIINMEVSNNTFFSSGGFDNYGLTSANISNNDFISNFEGLYIEDTKSEFYEINLNFFSDSYYATSNAGVNANTYNGNCFDEINWYNIEINNNTSIGLAQGEEGGTEAGNCFDKTATTIVTGQNTEFFTYHMKNNTAQADCKHPGSPGNNNWGLNNDALFPINEDCGSNFTSGIPPSLFNCNIPQGETAQLAFIDSLLIAIDSIVADTTLSNYQQRWLIQRLRKCLKKTEGKYVLDRKQETDGREKVLTLFQNSNDFDLHILAYGFMMNDGEYIDAKTYLQSLNTIGNTEQTEFVESQLIYIDHLRTGDTLATNDLAIIYDNAIERNPYSCFSRSIYYTLTGTRIDLPLIHLNNNQPRIQNEADDEEELYKVYPNPIRDNELHLESSEAVDVVVMDLSGRMIYRNPHLKDPVKVVLSDYIDNIYLVRFTNPEGKVTYKKVIRI